MNEPLHAPNRIGQSGLDRWRCFQRQVRTAEVVKGNPKCHSSRVMAERFAVSIGQPCETACIHAISIRARIHHIETDSVLEIAGKRLN